MRQIFKAILATLAVSAPVMAGAWPLWVVPSEWRPSAPGTITIQVLTESDGGTPVRPLPLDHIASLRIIDAHGSRDLGRALKRGGSPTIPITVRTTGSAIIAVETVPQTQTLGPDAFNAFLVREGFTEEVAAREKLGTQAQPAIVNIVYFLKSVVQTGDKASANYFAPIGQSLEVIPLDDPYAPTAGLPRLHTRTLDHGRPATRAITDTQPLFGPNWLGPHVPRIGPIKASSESSMALMSHIGGTLTVAVQLESAGDSVHYTLRYASLAIRLASE
jgi:hypothetical protein